MKQSELEIGHIYSNTILCRKLTSIEFHDDGKWYAHYTKVGNLLIRGKIHYMCKCHCLVSSFAKWSKRGLSEEMFIETRKYI